MNQSQQMPQLPTSASNGKSPNDWRSTVGMFTGDQIMREIDEAARKLRQADRRRARRARLSKARAKK